VPHLEALEARDLLSAAQQPTALAGVVLTLRRGDEFTATLATFHVAGPAQLTAAIDWGDGAHSTGTITSGGSDAYAVAGTSRYAVAGTFTITVTVTTSDDPGVTVTSRAVVYDLSTTFSPLPVSLSPGTELHVQVEGNQADVNFVQAVSVPADRHAGGTGTATPATGPVGGTGSNRPVVGNNLEGQYAGLGPAGPHPPAAQPVPPPGHGPAGATVQSEPARAVPQYVIWQRTSDHAAPRPEPPPGTGSPGPYAAVAIAVGTSPGVPRATDSITRVEVVIGVAANATDPASPPGLPYRLTVTVALPARPPEAGSGALAAQSGVDLAEVRAVVAFTPRDDSEAEEETGPSPGAAEEYFVRLRLLEAASRNFGRLTCADAAPERGEGQAVAAASPAADGPRSPGRMWRLGATWLLAQVLTGLAVPRVAASFRRPGLIHARRPGAGGNTRSPPATRAG
jgi:hypothetical protein